MLNKILLQIAKTVILSHFDDNYTLNTNKLIKKYPFLDKNGAAFVTLKYDEQLRGCIGSIIAHRKLLDDVMYNATSAAFSDPRFNSLSSHEFDKLKLDVSVLTTPEILEYTDFDDLVQKVQPHIDGLILQHESFQGTFLPQVWEQLPSPKDFLEHLSIKANSSPSIFSQHPNIYKYRVDAIEERFNAILPL